MGLLTCLLFVISAFYLPISNGYRQFEYCNGTSWIKFQGNCYLFQYRDKNRVSFYDAEDFCRSQGGHLASIHSEAENEFLLNTADEGRFGGRFWIGLNILAGKNNEQWTDDTAVDYSKKVLKEYYVNEKCFILMQSKRGWRPEDCSLHYAPLCKRSENAIPTPVPPVTTPSPKVGNCPRIGFSLVKSATDTLQGRTSFLDTTSIRPRYLAWIGMHQIQSDEIGHDLVFGWMDQSRTDFTYWARGHPPPGTWKYCACLNYEGVAKGEWVADYCEIDKKGYICQRPTDPEIPVPPPKPSKCGEGFVGYRNSCYKFISEPENHQNADKTCQNLGGHLVSIVDSFEQSFLFNFVEKKFKAVWNGLKTTQGTRYLSWTDKQPLYYSNWADNQPQLTQEQELCVSMDVTDDLKWNATSCSRNLPFVCEITNENIPKFPEAIGSCPSSESSWIDIGDKFCYHVAQNRNHILSWDATSRYCLTRGKFDASVHDSFIWTDGSTLDYTNWDNREPNSYSDDKDCVAFDQTTTKWKIISCSSGGVAVCQVPKIDKL
ncbi:Macrophage mannose receptor 1 like protein [Argiope bruennichi]|uniref:Macrophage mannose receptor 1 like protein n=1 Tax=Argiope bruennichi TaxID=94029 RepID=A0A8T0FVK5_ARGBR|nr:Macrophage mannose receptor 1 like protein [Argiope bruennichi]